MKIWKAIVPIALFAAGIAVGTRLHASDSTGKTDVKTLLQDALSDEFTPGREVLIDLVQIPPNTTLNRHWHPGEEFHYYMEGEVEIQMDGAKSIVGKPGGVGHVPYKQWHQAVAGKDGAKILVFRVHTKGEPWRYVDEEPRKGE